MKYPEKVIDFIVNWLKNYASKYKMKGFVIGVSGGIDSAVTSILCAKTNLPLLCLDMGIHQEKNQSSRALNHITWLQKQYDNVNTKSISLTRVFDLFKDSLPYQENKDLELLSHANSRARLRMMTLYHFATLNKYLVAGTGNKVEDFGIGFYTKYGDGGVDISPIADLLKSEVYLLASTLGIITEIQNASPTDGLWTDNRTDEDQIGASYEELEWAMKNNNLVDFKNISERKSQVISIFSKLKTQNKHKMNSIPVCKIPLKLK
tara:strand:- start:1505 stop:2293 length:789 start_codon:yes stop_codon:yes gene_type:complete